MVMRTICPLGICPLGIAALDMTVSKAEALPRSCACGVYVALAFCTFPDCELPSLHYLLRSKFQADVLSISQLREQV